MRTAAVVGHREREPALDALRIFGALVVFVKHSSFATGLQLRSGFHWLNDFEIGPALFFTLSAYLVYLPFARAFSARDITERNSSHDAPRGATVEAPSAPGLKTFVLARVLRVVPLYWFALIVLFAFDHQSADGIGIRFGGTRGLIELLTFTHIYDPKRFFFGIPAAYTLDVEMSFYVVFALGIAVLLAMATRSRARSITPRRELAAIATLFVVNVAWRIAVGHAVRPKGTVCDATHTHWTCAAVNWLPGFLDYFALGLILALAVARGARERVRAWCDRSVWRTRLPVASYVLAGACFALYSYRYGTVGLASLTGTDAELRHELTLVFAMLLVVPATLVRPRSQLLVQTLNSRVVRWGAVFTYGFYLWHQGLLDAMVQLSGGRPFHANFAIVAAGALTLSLVAAAVSWRLIEIPVGRLRSYVVGRIT